MTTIYELNKDNTIESTEEPVKIDVGEYYLQIISEIEKEHPNFTPIRILRKILNNKKWFEPLSFDDTQELMQLVNQDLLLEMNIAGTPISPPEQTTLNQQKLNYYKAEHIIANFSDLEKVKSEQKKYKKENQLLKTTYGYFFDRNNWITINKKCSTESEHDEIKKKEIQYDTPFNDELYKKYAKTRAENQYFRLKDLNQRNTPFYEIIIHDISEENRTAVVDTINNIAINYLKSIEVVSETTNYKRFIITEKEPKYKEINDLKLAISPIQHFHDDLKVHADNFHLHIIIGNKFVVNDVFGYVDDDHLDSKFFDEILPRELRKLGYKRAGIREIPRRELKNRLIHLGTQPYQLIDTINLSGDKKMITYTINNQTISCSIEEFSNILTHYRHNKEIAGYFGLLADKYYMDYRVKMGLTPINVKPNDHNSVIRNQLITPLIERLNTLQFINEHTRNTEIKAKIKSEEKELEDEVKRIAKTYYCKKCWTESRTISELIIKFECQDHPLINIYDVVFHTTRPPPEPPPAVTSA